MAEEDVGLNVEHLQLMKQVFESADQDGSGELDIDEFCEKLGPYLGKDLTRTQVAQLFLKIDADAGGTVDWDEFTSYMFLEHSDAQDGSSAQERWRLFAQDFREKNEPALHHHSQVGRVQYCQPMDKYVTCGRDGTVRLWSAADLKHTRTIENGSSWVTDCCHLARSRRLVVSSMDSSLSFYDLHRDCELIGKVFASGSALGIPSCLASLQTQTAERVVYGDSKGGVVLLCCSQRELPPRDLIHSDSHQDYVHLHREHSDWVTRLQHIAEVGLVSSSLDCTIKTYDLSSEKVVQTCDVHTKGVKDFVYCRAYSMFASCGLEREVALWAASTGRRIGSLAGHSASVAHIAIDESLNQTFTLATDRVIKVWDLRTHKCLQTIAEDDWVRRDVDTPESITYDPHHRRLISAQHHPYIWHHKMTCLDRTGHRDPLRAVMYNKVFSVVISVDEGGTVCVWNALTGARESRFMRAHGDSKLTAACLDFKQRRLLTAANDGSIHMWNFRGHLLRKFVHPLAKQEITCLLFSADEKRGLDSVYAAGWNCRVFVWEDDNEEVVSDCRAFEGHREDILHMAALPEKHLLATGDYEGRINVYNMFTGERRMWLAHRAERYETCVERLQWLRAKVLPPGSVEAAASQQPIRSAAKAQQGTPLTPLSPRSARAPAPEDEAQQQPQQQQSEVGLSSAHPSALSVMGRIVAPGIVRWLKKHPVRLDMPQQQSSLASVAASPAAAAAASGKQPGASGKPEAASPGPATAGEPSAAAAAAMPEEEAPAASTVVIAKPAARSSPAAAGSMFLKQLAAPPLATSSKRSPQSPCAPLPVPSSPAPASVSEAAQHGSSSGSSRTAAVPHPHVPPLRIPGPAGQPAAVGLAAEQVSAGVNASANAAASSAGHESQLHGGTPPTAAHAASSSQQAPPQQPGNSLPPQGTAAASGSSIAADTDAAAAPSTAAAAAAVAAELMLEGLQLARGTVGSPRGPPLELWQRAHKHAKESDPHFLAHHPSLQKQRKAGSKLQTPRGGAGSEPGSVREEAEGRGTRSHYHFEHGQLVAEQQGQQEAGSRPPQQYLRQQSHSHHGSVVHSPRSPRAPGSPRSKLHGLHAPHAGTPDADQAPQQQQQQQQDLPGSTGSDRSGPAAEDSTAADVAPAAATSAMSVLQQAVVPGKLETFLLSCGGDGDMRVWLIQGFGGQLLATLRAVHGRYDQVSAMCADEGYRHIVVGDTSGSVLVWDVSEGLDISSEASCRASFRVRSHFRAMDAAVSSIDVVPGRELLVVGGRDCNVSMWTYEGGLVGVLGEHSWQLDEPDTWQDPHALRRREPRGELEGTYGAQAAAAEAAAAQAQAQAASAAAAGGAAAAGSEDPEAAVSRLRELKRLLKESAGAPHSFTGLALKELGEVSRAPPQLAHRAAAGGGLGRQARAGSRRVGQEGRG